MIKQLDPQRKLSEALPQAYLDTFVNQYNRPQAMQYFEDLVAAGGMGRVEQVFNAKEKTGCIAVGSFCVYAPEEIVLAVDGIAFSLCSGTEVSPDEVEKHIPRNTCALIKGMLGFKLTGKCPYMSIADLIVGETTCDGKKKAYETFAEISPTPLHIMELPNKKSEQSKSLWLSEIKSYAAKIEEISKRTITVESLKQAFIIANNKRRALQRLAKLRTANPVPISGLDSLLINQLASSADPIEVTQHIELLCDELEERIAAGVGVAAAAAKRVLVGGSPMAMPNWKLPNIIEKSGAVIVGEESCVGARNYRDLLETSFTTLEEGYALIMQRHMKMDCACFTPNTERLDNVFAMAKEQAADGIVHYALQFCTPFTMEAFKIKKAADEREVPFLKIETDYSQEDIGQLKTRVEAFLEML